MITDKMFAYCYNNETRLERNKHFSLSHKNNNPLTSLTISDGLCIPDRGLLECFSGGVFDKNNVPVKDSFQRNSFTNNEKLISSIDAKSIDYDDREVVFLGQIRNHWGSFLVDSISRMWYVIDNPNKYTYVFMITQPSLGMPSKNLLRFLELFGLNLDNVIFLKEPRRFKKVIIPELSYKPLESWHQLYLDTIYKVVDNVDIESFSKYGKVYFSRARFSKKTKNEFGENFIETFFSLNGYHIVYPEECTLDEQIAYVNNCDAFACIGGSCAHNIIFSKSKPKFLLFNRMNDYQWHQWMLNEISGVDTFYVDCYNEPYKPLFRTTISGPYLYGINKNVNKFAKDFNMQIPNINFVKRFSVAIRYTVCIIRQVLFRLKIRMVRK